MEKILNVELKKESINLIEKPFPYFYIDNFIEPNLFQTLLADYKRILPEMEFRTGETELWRQGEPVGTTYLFGGGVDGDTVEKFAILTERSAAWNKVLHYMNSPEFLFGILDVFRDTLPFIERKRNKKIKYRSGHYRRSVWDKLFNFSCYINFKISRYTNNVGLLQHQDHGFKVVALLLYMDDSGFGKDSIAGTQIWSNEKDPKLASWTEYTLTREERGTLVLHEDIKYVPNRLAVFLRAPNSWHGVTPVDIPRHLTRDTLQINVMTSHKQGLTLKFAHKLKKLFSR